MTSPIKQAATKAMSTPKITLRPSSARGHAHHDWLNTYHTFSFASYHDPRYISFGSLRVLNEDRVSPLEGFDTHHHQNAEIFSYILNGELTHRDSMLRKGTESAGGSSNKDLFYRMRRGDVQFTTGGTGIAHSEQNEHSTDEVHFLQIWALPWKRGLTPRYHSETFSEDEKRKGFVPIITPLKAGINASKEEEAAAVPAVDGTIPIHADLVFSAGIIGKGQKFGYAVGGPKEAAVNSADRKVYVHVPMTKEGKAKIKLVGSGSKEEALLMNEGDGAFVEKVNTGDELTFESVGDEEAEVLVLDSH
ncbi:MAG: hypothetical protein Q9227_004881 [Pyrenula ochraceoflavens]